MRCEFCGLHSERVPCERCEYVICEVCGDTPARGYCAVCGRLVCNQCSALLGPARVCRECAERWNLSSYDDLKRLSLSRDEPRGGKLELVASLGSMPATREVYVSLGLDDVDSPLGECTTRVAAEISLALFRAGFRFCDYPLLVRLNPNVPMKTRGNASVCIRLRIPRSEVEEVINSALRIVERLSHIGFAKTKTALVVYISEKPLIPARLREIYERALRSVVIPHDALARLRVPSGRLEIYAARPLRGVVGALAAVGASFEDWTFELLAYRRTRNPTRDISHASVLLFDNLTRALTFANVDGSRVLVTPHGLDPVLYGVRGDDPEPLLQALWLLGPERPRLWCIFRTNQATGVHVSRKKVVVSSVFESVRSVCEVVRVTSEGSALVAICDADGWLVKLYAHAPQSELRRLVRSLVQGDVIEFAGAVVCRSQSERVICINLEWAKLVRVAPRMTLKNPLCPLCQARLESKGRSELRCPRCGFRLRRKLKLLVVTPREIERAEASQPLRYVRHLTLLKERRHASMLKTLRVLSPYLLVPFVGTDYPVVTVRLPVVEFRTSE